MIYIGLDLGDGESCVHWTRDASGGIVNVVPVSGAGSFLSAITQVNGKNVIGNLALSGMEDAQGVNVCFKRHFLENNPETDQTIQDFVTGILTELRSNPDVGPYLDEAQFIVGCPAGWKPEDRERYRQLMERAGMKNVSIISESRAAFENALRSKENNIDPDLVKQTVLVIDIGSSTLDFAYVKDGNEYGVTTMGNVMLGGGLMDEMIVLRSLELQAQTMPEQVQEIHRLIESSPAKKGKLMLAVRELKETYFNNEDEFLAENKVLDKTVRLIANNKVYKVLLQISPEIVENWLISRPHPLLDNQSFESRLKDSLTSVYDQTKKQKLPDLVILTGGPSRMSFFQELCRNRFLSSRVIVSENPEYDISRGLVYVGGADEGMNACIEEIREYADSDAVENKIEAAIPELVDSISEPLADAVLEECVKPAFRDWQNGALRSLNDFQSEVEKKAERYMNSSTMMQVVRKHVDPWSKRVIASVEEDISQIAQKHQVDFAMENGDLTISLTGGNQPPIRINFVEMIEAVVSVVVVVIMSMICGGSGMALLAAGPLGIILGAIIGIAAVVLGRDAATDIIMSMNIPVILRRFFNVNSIASQENKRKITDSVSSNMKNDQNLRKDLVAQVSNCIDTAITNAANDVQRAMAS